METQTRIKTDLEILLDESPQLPTHRTSAVPLSNYSTVYEDKDGELVRINPRISKFQREYN